MPITLPDFTALPTVTPQAGGNLLQYPQNDAGAVALGELGKGAQAAGGALVDIAAYRDIAQTKADRASADADFTNATVPLTEQLKNETDPEKITALRGKFQEALEAAGGNFTNPQARDFWMKGHAKTVANGAAFADERNRAVYNDSYLAGLQRKVTAAGRTGSDAEDPMAFGASLVNIDSLIDGAKGQVSEVKLEEMRSKGRAEMVAGRIAALNARGRGDEARALLHTYRSELGGVLAGHLDDTIAAAGERKRGQDEKKQGEDYERWLNGEGPRPAAPGARPRDGAGAAAGPIAGETQETLQADYAKRSGAFGTPEQAGNNLTTVTAPGGSSFRVHKLAAPQVQGFVNELEQNGYKIDPATSGGYNNRNKVGVDTSEKSEHAFGTAIDINWDRNKQADTLITDLPANVGEIAAKWGLKWGGTFTGKKDAMHFEVARLAGAPAAPGAGPTATAQAPDRVDNWEARNNNFGGIRKQGADPNATTAEGGFEAYPTPEAGVQAIADNLRRYAAGGVVTEMNPDGKPLNTIRGIVSTWAPPSQNDTNALIGRASRSTGFKPDQPIDLKDPATMAKVIEATVRNEFGGKLPVAPAIITKVAGGVPSTGATGPAPAPLGAGGAPGPAAPPAGQLEPGNIDLNARPVVKNPDGSISTVASISINEDGKEVLIPTVAADGSRILTNDEAIKQYHDTGQHLGKFDTVDNANAAAEALHQAQAQQYAPGAPPQPAPGAAPDWAALGQRIRESDLPPGAKTAAFQKLEERKRMFEFGKQEALPKYNAQVHAAVEQRIDDIVQGAARSDDPEVRRKAEGELATVIKWGVDSGAVPANKGYEAERTAKAQLVTGHAQYLDAGGRSDEALAFIQQNKDTLPPQIYQEQVRNLTPRAENQQGTRFERELQIGGGPGYVPGAPTPGMLPGGPADFPTPLAPSPFQQKLQAIADSDLPEGAKKAAHDAALARHSIEVVGQDRARSDLEMAIRKGEAGRLDVEQAYRAGQIAPAARTEMHHELDKIDATRNAEAAAMAKVNNAANGGAPLDPKSESDKTALNFHFDKVSAGWPANEATARSIDYATKYGLIPDRLKGLIRGSLHSGNPADMVAAAGTINQIRNRNPELVGEIGDQNDMRLATLLQTYTDAGIRPDRAVELATSGMKVGAPEREARSQAFDDERGKSKADQHTSDTSWLGSQLNSIWRPDPDVDPVMRKEFEEVSRAEYQRTGNLEASRRMALDNINNIWGRTRVGGDLRYMKQAPEKYYGVPGLSDRENASWMNEQLAGDMRKDALQDPSNPIATERLHLVQAPDRTAPDGRPAYQVWLEHPTTKAWELVTRPDGQARVWAPDWTTSAEKQRRDLALQQTIGLLRQERSVGPAGVGAGPGGF